MSLAGRTGGEHGVDLDTRPARSFSLARPRQPHAGNTGNSIYVGVFFLTNLFYVNHNNVNFEEQGINVHYGMDRPQVMAKCQRLPVYMLKV